MNIRIQINERAVIKKFVDAGYSKLNKIAYDRAYSLYYRSKQKMLEEFDKSNITQELMAGMDNPEKALNISGTLDGYGNLYSFIGFEEGTDPIQPLRLLLESGTFFQKTSFRDGTWYFKITIPDKEAIYSQTPMPWENGNSWVRGIEEGMSNLSHYLNIKYGRSTGGFQSEYEVNEGLVFKRTPYISEILTDFRQRVNNK